MTQSNSTSEGFRLSRQQRHLWLLQQAEQAQPFRTLCAMLVEGNLQADVIEQALSDVVSRHEILRTTFVRPPGIKTPFQVISETAVHSWQTVDLGGLDTAQQLSRVEAFLAEAQQQRFDFERGPLLRVALFRVSSDRHVLTVSLPAMCGDSRTLTNLIQDLSRAYESRLNHAELTVDPMQYADYAEWQHELVESDDEHAQATKAYWKQQVASVHERALPLEKRSGGPPVFAPDSITIDFDSISFAQIESAARRQTTSLSCFLFACWQALIWRLMGQPEFEFVIFNLLDGRKLQDLQDALGIYAKFVPVRCRCDNRSFVSHLLRTSGALAQAIEWQDYFDPANGCILAKDSVAFDFEEWPVRYEAAGLSFSQIKDYACLGPFKLKLSCKQLGASLRASLHYDPRVFDHGAVTKIADYLQRFLYGVILNPQAELAALEIVGDDQRRHLLVQLNQTDIAFPKDKCVNQLFEEQVEKTPNEIAVFCDDQELTYDELNASANQLAHMLQRGGVRPGARVGLCLERSANMIVGLLGILKAGGAYVPLNPEHPKQRLMMQLAESEVSIVITSNGGMDQTPEFAGKTIDFQRDAALLEAEPRTNPPLRATPEDLVYVIYTSGSTGVPKGVAVRHRNLVNYAQFIVRRLHADKPLHFAIVSTITADLGNTCIFPSLISGGRLHILGYDVAIEGELFSDYVTRRPIDVLKIVPSHLDALLASQPGAEFFPSKYLILGGEALSWDLFQRISRIDHTCKIINHYGPTETTVGSLTFGFDERDDSASSLTVPIGRPIANTRVYILDQCLRPVPAGVVGELYIGGAGVAAGYLNQPSETAARFLPDPFSTDQDSRLYRTGDLARYLSDYNIEFLGRADQQVKLRGYRVELGEIEAALSAHPQVRQTVVVIRRDSSSDERTVAFVVADGGSPPGQNELRNFLKEKLPDYMVPSAFVFLKALPLTPNGKVDRAALPAAESRAELKGVFVAPRTPVERRIAGIWAEVLRVSEVGAHDNFFELGGHSLLATQVVSRMRGAFQMEITLRSLFESPTVSDLAARIEVMNANKTAELLSKLEGLSDEEAQRLLDLEGVVD